MKKLCLFLLLVSLLAASPLLASNMGFKLNYTLRAVAGTTGTNWVAIPYFYAPTTAKAVCNDIGPNAATVGVFDPTTDLSMTYFCEDSEPGFTINPGQALLVRVNTDNTVWIIVGSHNDTLNLILRNLAGTTGSNWVSVPYHFTGTTAKSLCTDIGANAATVGVFDAATDASTTFYCEDTNPGFNLVPGQAVLVRVNADNTSYHPSHY